VAIAQESPGKRQRPGRDAMRRLTWLAVAMLVACTGAASAADDYPARPVRVIIGFGPGATADITLRTLTPKLGSALASNSWSRTAPAPAATRRRFRRAWRPRTATRCCSAPSPTPSTPRWVRSSISTRQRLRADHADRDRAEHPGGASLDRGEERRHLIRLVKAKPDGLSYGSSGAAPRCISRPSCST